MIYDMFCVNISKTIKSLGGKLGEFRLKVCQIFPPTTSASRAGDFLTQDYHLRGGGGGGCHAMRTKCVLNELDFHFNKH